MDKEIPYHLLFLLEHEGKLKAVIGYKETASGKTAFKTHRYYATDWMPEEALPLHAEGLSVDAVYENFVRQIAVPATEAGESLRESVARDDKRRELEAKIAKLQKKIHGEKQLNRQMEINAQLKELKKKLEVLI